MLIGIPKETKVHEYRVGMTPEGVEASVCEGAAVFIERGAGLGAGFSDREYRDAGAKVLPKASEVWKRAELIVKVKEPQRREFAFLRPGLVLFTYLHLAANPQVEKVLRKSGVAAIAYETVETPDGRHPLLEPMSLIAGHLAGLLGANFLRRDLGGKGISLASLGGSGVGRVLVLGAGNVGQEAVRVVCGLGAQTTVFDQNPDKIADLRKMFPAQVKGLSDAKSLPHAVQDCDLLIGGVLVSGRRTPILITRAMVQSMEPGSVIIDVAVDQGGCVETIRPTKLDDPIYIKYGVIHCGVSNLPSLVARTATRALAFVTLPYVLKMARLGVEAALAEDTSLRKGLVLPAV